jgi:hypothetical protein
MLTRTLIIFFFITIFIYQGLSQSSDSGVESSANIQGQVLDAVTLAPLPGITVRVLGTNLGAITKSDGKFLIKNVPFGIYSIQFSSIGHETYVESSLPVAAGKPISLLIKMVDKVIELEGAEVRASYFQKQIEASTSTNSLSALEIRRTPGIQEDVIQAASLLPGVAVAAAGRNDLLVRGGAPYENLFIVDNVEVPNINHFGSQGVSGGPLSIINIDLIRNVDFATG